MTIKKHDKCKYFGYHSCPYKDDEIMKKATQNLPEYYGGNYPLLSFPKPEEIDAICSKCDKFTLVQRQDTQCSNRGINKLIPLFSDKFFILFIFRYFNDSSILFVFTFYMNRNSNIRHNKPPVLTKHWSGCKIAPLNFCVILLKLMNPSNEMHILP